ncbi:MAG: T9SS type A sorting domain-containing protein [Microbacter sp.]
MKKVFTLFVTLFIGVVAAYGTIYSFGNITSNMVTTNAAGSLSTATITDSALCVYDYGVAAGTAGTLMTLDVPSQLPNIEIQYTNSSSKTGFLKFYPNVFYTGGKGVSIVISNVNINDSIIIHTTAKGTTSDTWTVTGASTSSNLSNITNASWVDLRFQATGTTVILKETNGGFKISTINWFSNVGTAISTSKANALTIRSVPGAILISQPADVQLLNVTGKEVMNVSNTTSVSTGSLPKGVYLVRAQTSTGSMVQKVIVQ